MERHRVSGSSMIVGLGYDSDEQLLEIRFRNGKTYQYRLVPQSVFREFLNASSAGEYFLNQIRPRYPYREVLDSTD